MINKLLKIKTKKKKEKYFLIKQFKIIKIKKNK